MGRPPLLPVNAEWRNANSYSKELPIRLILTNNGYTNIDILVANAGKAWPFVNQGRDSDLVVDKTMIGTQLSASKYQSGTLYSESYLNRLSSVLKKLSG